MPPQNYQNLPVQPAFGKGCLFFVPDFSMVITVPHITIAPLVEDYDLARHMSKTLGLIVRNLGNNSHFLSASISRYALTLPDDSSIVHVVDGLKEYLVGYGFEDLSASAELGFTASTKFGHEVQINLKPTPVEDSKEVNLEVIVHNSGI